LKLSCWILSNTPGNVLLHIDD